MNLERLTLGQLASLDSRVYTRRINFEWVLRSFSDDACADEERFIARTRVIRAEKIERRVSTIYQKRLKAYGRQTEQTETP